MRVRVLRLESRDVFMKIAKQAFVYKKVRKKDLSSSSDVYYESIRPI